MSRGIQKNVDEAIDRAWWRGHSRGRKTQAARNRRAHGIEVKSLTFDGARGETIFDQNRGHRLQGQAGIEQPRGPQHLALGQSRAGQQRRERGDIPAEPGPVGLLPDPGMMRLHVLARLICATP